MALSSMVYSQSSLLLPQTSSSSLASIRVRSACCSISFVCLKKCRLASGVVIHRNTWAEQQHRRSKEIVRVVADTEVTPLIVESAGEEAKFPPDTSGGDGLGGGDGGGGGGGGGGDNGSSKGDNNEGEGGSNEKDSNKKKMALSMSQKLTLGYAALVGVGGVMGYLKSGSQKSLAAGGLSAMLLYYVYTELPVRPAFASSLGLGLSAVLLGVMGSRFKNSKKIFPAGVVSLVSLVMTGGYLHGLLRSVHG